MLVPLNLGEAIEHCEWRGVKTRFSMNDNCLHWFCHKCGEKHVIEDRNQKLWSGPYYKEYVICKCDSYFYVLSYDEVRTPKC